MHILLRFIFSFLSKLFNPSGLPVCRFTPSCSEYAQDAVRQHGWKSVFFIAKRLSRCHPWGSWGYDPVPSPQSLTASNQSRHPKVARIEAVT